MNSRVDRRRFLAAAGAAGAGLMAGEATAVEGIGDAPRRWDMSADVVVVGTGAAGFAAAVTAHSRGASVLLLEKGAIAGGTSAKSGGVYWIPNNPIMQAAGIPDPREDALKLMVRLAHPTRYVATSPTLGIEPAELARIAVIYDRGAETILHLAKIGALKSATASREPAPGADHNSMQLQSSGWPDYHADLPENRVLYGRGMRPEAQGFAGGGVLIRQMKDYTDLHKVPVLSGHRAVAALLGKHGEVAGLAVETQGKRISVQAKKGVVFASGGFIHNAAMRRAYLKGPAIYNGCGVMTNTGDFVAIATALGAPLGNMTNAWWLQQPLEVALTAPGVSAEVWVPTGDSMIEVNKYGRRVVNEKMPYNERTQAHFYWDPSRREYPNHILFMLYDEAVAQSKNNMYPIPRPGFDASYVLKGQSWAELASVVDARLESLGDRIGNVRLSSDFVTSLQQTVQRFNHYAATGNDEEFGRGSTPVQRFFNHAPADRSAANPTLYPFAETGPYYCVPLVAGTLDTKGGPVINEHSQVLNGAGEPIAGLYGAGNCVASPTAQAYWSAGATLGCALVQGYAAAMHATGHATGDRG